jgi:glucokinase
VTDSGPVLAVDIGCTKLAAAVVLPSALVIGSAVQPTPQGADAETLWGALRDLVADVLHSVGLPVTAAGVGCGRPRAGGGRLGGRPWLGARPGGRAGAGRVGSGREPGGTGRVRRAGTMLGRGIASAVAVLDVTPVVVGGGCARSGELLFGPLRTAYARHAGLPQVRVVQVVPAALGDDTGLLGDDTGLLGDDTGLLGAAALVVAGDRYWTGD